MDFAKFIAPMSVAEFRRDYYQQKPLHLQAAGNEAEARREILDWTRFNQLLSVRGVRGPARRREKAGESTRLAPRRRCRNCRGPTRRR